MVSFCHLENSIYITIELNEDRITNEISQYLKISDMPARILLTTCCSLPFLFDDYFLR